MIYDSFAATLGTRAAIDFYIYSNNYGLFEELIGNRKKDYSYYVNIPHFLDGGENTPDIINSIPKEKLILMDKLLSGVEGKYSALDENFKKDIYNSLKEALPQLSKYHTLNIIFPDYTYHPQEILKGFSNFCYDYAFHQKIVSKIEPEEIKKGEVYINLMENDLVILIEKILLNDLKIGEEAGVISYNETTIKKY